MVLSKDRLTTSKIDVSESIDEIQSRVRQAVKKFVEVGGLGSWALNFHRWRSINILVPWPQYGSSLGHYMCPRVFHFRLSRTALCLLALEIVSTLFQCCFCFAFYLFGIRPATNTCWHSKNYSVASFTSLREYSAAFHTSWITGEAIPSHCAVFF